MKWRGYNHNSPYKLPDLSMYCDINKKVDVVEAMNDLKNRCLECCENINGEIK